MTELFCRCAILVLISVQQSQMEIGITCSEQCPIGYICSVSRGFSECVPGSVSSIEQQLDSVISNGSGEPITWNTFDKLIGSLEFALQKIIESKNSVSNIPGSENTTPGPGEIVINPESRATPKDTNIIVTQNPTTRTPERRDTTTPALEFGLQKIIESKNSVSNIPGPENTTPVPGEIVTNPGSRATPKDTNIIVTQNPTNRPPERRDTTTPVAVTGCKKCTENSQCTVTREYCYHSPRCATRICQPL